MVYSTGSKNNLLMLQKERPSEKPTPVDTTILQHFSQRHQTGLVFFIQQPLFANLLLQKSHTV
jgi:hypothetical protein